MKVVKNPLIGTWELAESEGVRRQREQSGYKACTPHCILIADDEENLASAYLSALKRMFPGCVFHMVANGRELVDAFEKHHPEVIVSDISMPVINGEEAFNHIQAWCDERKWQMPAVIFCTGYNPTYSLRQVVAADPAHCLLRKPVRNKILVDAVSKRISP